MQKKLYSDLIAPDITKLGNYRFLCTDKKNLQNKSIKVWLTLFKTWKQFL